MIALIFCGCNAKEVKNDTNYLPASVFRSDAKMALNSYYGNEQILERSIFRPQFLRYLNSIYETTGAVDIAQVKKAVLTWNAVMTGGKDRIEFKPMHFYRLAGLSDNNAYDCDSTDKCKISEKDILLVQNWHQFQSENIAEVIFNSEVQ